MSDGPAQRPYVAARVGFEPATFRTHGTEPTTKPARPTRSYTPVYINTSPASPASPAPDKCI